MRQCLCAFGRVGGRDVKQLRQVDPGLGGHAPGHPELLELQREPDPGPGLVGIGGAVVECRPEVGVLAEQPVAPRHLVRADPFPLERPGELETPVAVPLAQSIRFTGGAQHLLAVLAYRLQ